MIDLSVEVEQGRPGPPAGVESGDGEAPVRQKSLTIGAVVKQLEREFPEISISKVRYLEDQKLLTPRRTQGGYRLYTPGDLDRLRTILRLQRDEFLPLRVIRQELASGRAAAEQVPAAASGGADARALRRTRVGVSGGGAPGRELLADHPQRQELVAL